MDEGGYLATVNSEAEAKLIESLFVNHTKYQFAHIGFYSPDANGQFVTISGVYDIHGINLCRVVSEN